MLVLQAEKFMRYQLIKNANLLALMLLLCFSCKKETNVEILIDAFNNLDTEVTNADGIYTIRFTLEEYAYKEVGLKIALDKSMIFKNTSIVNQPTYQVSKNRYGTFINNLQASKTYYYQIYVKDTQGTKEVVSDIFSFKTTP